MIVVLGSINRDVVMTTPRLPDAGETVTGVDHFEAPGGKGANQAVAAARLGADVRFLGRVGDDAAGRWLRQGLETEGVDATSLIVDAEAPSGLAVITVDAAGENSIVVVPGANGRVSPSDVVAWRPVIEAADFLLMQLEVPSTAVAAAAEMSPGVVILNAAPAPSSVEDLPPPLLHRVDVLVVNQTEARGLGGVEVPTTIVTRGPEGAEVRRGRSVETVSAPTVDALDTTGAGDAFCGALVAALAAGAEMDEAVQRAVYVGALATTARGARDGMPTTAELGSFLG